MYENVQPNLERDSPRVRVLIINPDDPSRYHSVIAEIDTGTWLSGIEPRIAEEIGLKSFGSADTHTTASSETTKQDLVKARLAIELGKDKRIDLGIRPCSVHAVEPFKAIQARMARELL